MRPPIALTLLLILTIVWALPPTKAVEEAPHTDSLPSGKSGTVEANVDVQVEENVVVEGNVVEKQVPVEIMGEVNAQEMNQIHEMVREVIEKNVPVVERNGLIAEKRGETVVVRKAEGRERPPERVTEVAERLARVAGIEVNVDILVERGQWKEVMRVKNKVIIRVAKAEKNVVVAKEVTFDEKNGVVEGNIAVAADVKGVYLVEENLPKGAEVDLNVPFVVLNFDPVIAWVVELNGGEVEMVSYRVRSTVPPELAPTVERLAECDVEVKVEKVVRKGDTISGQFQILLAGTPVYTKDVEVSGTWSFVKDGMYYVFEGKEPVTVEGKVGDCSFYREIGSEKEQGQVFTVMMAVFLVALVVAAYLLFRR